MEQLTRENFIVKHETFVGPIEVLLELIEKRKLFVNDVSLAAVTDDFITYIRERGMHPDLVANFLSVAATLILIKARSLLPNIELTTEEHESISDLERRVALYSVIVEISGTLSQEYNKHISFAGVSRMSGVVFAPDDKLTVDMLASLIGDAVVRIPPVAPKAPEARVFKSISITEVLATLEERMQRAMSMSFNAIRVHSPDADEKSQKVYTIVSFLGMLELVRRGLVDATQTELFEDIVLEKQPDAEQITQKTESPPSTRESSPKLSSL